MVLIPEVLADALALYHGPEVAARWVPEAIAAAERLAAAHRVELGEVLTGGATALVFAGVLPGGQRVVVKVPPGDRAADEIRGMQAFAGTGTPAVLAVNAERTAYVMERVEATSRVVTAVEVRALAARVQKPGAVLRRGERGRPGGLPCRLPARRATHRHHREPCPPARGPGGLELGARRGRSRRHRPVAVRG